METLRAAIEYIKQLQKTLGLDTDITGCNNQLSSNVHSKTKTQDLSDSDPERSSEETFRGKFDDDEADLTSTTFSGRDDRLSSGSGENDDILSSEFSPKAKVEIASPSSSFVADGICENDARKSCDYQLKGRIFCKSSKDLLRRSNDQDHYENYQNSCCWVGNQNPTHFRNFSPNISPECKEKQFKLDSKAANSTKIKISSNYNGASDLFSHFSNVDRPSSCNPDGNCCRKRSARNFPLWQRSESENCFFRQKFMKQAKLQKSSDFVGKFNFVLLLF